MGTKTFVILCVIIALLGIGVGVVLNARPATNSPKNVTQQQTSTKTPETQEDNAPIPFNSLPSPVIPPVQDTVKVIGENSITIEGVNGEMTLPIDSSVVKFYRRQGDQLIPLSLDELKVGDSVEVNVIKPGELIHLIV